MIISPKKLKELLVLPDHISEADFDVVQKEAIRKNIPIENVIIENGLISSRNLGEIIASALDFQYVDLKNENIGEEALKHIPEKVAQFQDAIIFREDSDRLYMATSRPDNYEFIKLIEKESGKPVEVYYTTPADIKEALHYYKSDVLSRLKKTIEDSKINFKEESVVDIVDLLLEYAQFSRASDIHLEPLGHDVSVRLRIDGVLHQIAEYQKDLHEKIALRIKIMAHLRTDEHQAAQDGGFVYEKEGYSFDVRVSFLPITFGENIVMRIFAEQSQRLTIDTLGLQEEELKKVKREIEKPHGMILVVGPTGSGKTTTLYAFLQTLNKPEVNIMTIEDPVEYQIEHVQQTTVNPKKNILFSTGLRSVVRQDPDIIMVGEVRDNETAEIAVNAAMTGHLLLSTLHANDAATTFPRLLDMDIEPFLLASSINMIIAQRLVRKICEKCKESYRLSSTDLGVLNLVPNLNSIIEKISGEKDISAVRFYRGAGCKICAGTGYSGRTGIFEIMQVEEEIRSLIVKKSPFGDIDKKAKELGMISMLQSGIIKVFQGITTVEEVLMVVKV